jgi:hypothetical protein
MIRLCDADPVLLFLEFWCGGCNGAISRLPEVDEAVLVSGNPGQQLGIILSGAFVPVIPLPQNHR